jgi:hypothetical protein
MAVVTSLHGTFTGKDSTGTPITVELKPSPGNVSFPDLEEAMREVTPIYNRGTFVELVYGSQKAQAFSLETMQDGKLTDVATGKPLDLALKQGTFAAGTTADPGGLVWTVNGTLVMTRNGVTSTVTITNARVKISVTEDPGGNKLAISGTAYGTGSTLPIVVT